MSLPILEAHQTSTGKRLFSLVLCAASLGLLPSCDGSYQAPTIERPVAVIADLGEAASVDVGVPVILDGSGSYLGAGAEAFVLTYHWSLASAPLQSTLGDADLEAVGDDPSRVQFSPDHSGIYAITLQVDDSNDDSDLAHAVIEVGGGNLCPTADAGPDLTGQVGVPVTLDGSASVDADAAPGDDDDSALEQAELEYSWHLTLVPTGSTLDDSHIYYQGTVNPILIADVPGTYIMQLRVDDGSCTSAPDYLTIQVDSGNLTPVANAGESIVLSPCAPSEVILDGSASYDPEGQPLNFQWEFTSVPTSSAVSDALMVGRYTANPRFNWDVPGIYTLRVTADDGENTSPPDYVAIQATPSEPNQPPIADGGGHVIIDADAACSGPAWNNPGGSCAPCSPRTVQLDATASSDPDSDPLSFHWDLRSGNASLLGVDSDALEVSLPELVVNYGGFSSASFEVGLTVYDCRGADSDTINITLNCHGD